MRSRLWRGGLLALFLVTIVGCGGSGAGESPKVQNSNVKVKAITPKAKPGEEGGASPKAFEG